MYLAHFIFRNKTMKDVKKLHFIRLNINTCFSKREIFFVPSNKSIWCDI